MKKAVTVGLFLLAMLGTERVQAIHESHGDGGGQYSYLLLVTNVSASLYRAPELLPLDAALAKRLSTRWENCQFKRFSGDETMAVVTTRTDFCQVAVRPRVWTALYSTEARWLAMCDAVLYEVPNVNAEKVCSDVWDRDYALSTPSLF